MNIENFKPWILSVTAVIILAALYFAFVNSGAGTRQTAERTDAPPVPSVADSPVDFGSKERQFLNLLTQDPENASLHAALGDLYFDNSRFDQAISSYRKAIDLNPQDVDSYNDLGLALHYTGQSQDGIDILKKGATADSSYQRIWLSLGFVQASSGETGPARESLEKAIALGPETQMGREAKRIRELLQ